MLQKRPNVLIVFHQEDAGHRRWLPRNWAEAPTRQRDPAPPVPCCCNPCELRASRPCERLGRGEPPIDLMQLKTRAAAGRNVPSSAVSLSRPWFLHSARSLKNAPMTQPAQKPAFDDQHGRLDLRLIARAPRAGWQHRRVVMRRHLGVGAVDLWLAQTRP